MVRCADCAFFGMVPRPGQTLASLFFEAPPEVRRDHVPYYIDIPTQAADDTSVVGTRYDVVPACFRGRDQSRDGGQSILELQHGERDCDLFYPVYSSSWTAAQHLEAQRVETLETQRRDWEADQQRRREESEERHMVALREYETRRDADRVAFEERMEESRRRLEAEREEERRVWEKNLHDSTQATQRGMLRTSIVGLAITIAAVMLSVWATAEFGGTNITNEVVLPTPLEPVSTSASQS